MGLMDHPGYKGAAVGKTPMSHQPAFLSSPAAGTESIAQIRTKTAGKVFPRFIHAPKDDLGRIFEDRSPPFRAFTAERIDSGGIEGDKGGAGRPTASDWFVLKENEAGKTLLSNPPEEVPDLDRRGNESFCWIIANRGPGHGAPFLRKGKGRDDRIKKESHFFSKTIKSPIRFFEPGFVEKEVMTGNHAAEMSAVAPLETAAQKIPGRRMASVAQKIVKRNRTVQTDLHRKARIRNQRLRKAAGQGAAGYDLNLVGVLKRSFDDGG